MASSVWNSTTRSTFFAHELVSVPECDSWLVLVVYDNQLDVCLIGSGQQAVQHFAREGADRPLCRVAEAVAPAPFDFERKAVAADVDFFEEAAEMERVQQAEAAALAQARARHDIAEAQHLTWRCKRLEHL